MVTFWPTVLSPFLHIYLYPLPFVIPRHIVIRINHPIGDWENPYPRAILTKPCCAYRFKVFFR